MESIVKLNFVSVSVANDLREIFDVFGRPGTTITRLKEEDIMSRIYAEIDLETTALAE